MLADGRAAALLARRFLSAVLTETRAAAFLALRLVTAMLAVGRAAPARGWLRTHGPTRGCVGMCAAPVLAVRLLPAVLADAGPAAFLALALLLSVLTDRRP